MTAPALYRYVDSHAALQEALSASILDDVLVRVQEAASAWPAQRHGHRLVASLVAFRNWALDRPEEFRLVFGRPRDPQGSSLPMPGPVSYTHLDVYKRQGRPRARRSRTPASAPPADPAGPSAAPAARRGARRRRPAPSYPTRRAPPTRRPCAPAALSPRCRWRRRPRRGSGPRPGSSGCAAAAQGAGRAERERGSATAGSRSPVSRAPRHALPAPPRLHPGGRLVGGQKGGQERVSARGNSPVAPLRSCFGVAI